MILLRAPTPRDLTIYHTWYAWRPVYITEGDRDRGALVWLEFVSRRCTWGDYTEFYYKRLEGCLR